MICLFAGHCARLSLDPACIFTSLPCPLHPCSGHGSLTIIDGLPPDSIRIHKHSTQVDWVLHQLVKQRTCSQSVVESIYCIAYDKIGAAECRCDAAVLTGSSRRRVRKTSTLLQLLGWQAGTVSGDLGSYCWMPEINHKSYLLPMRIYMKL